MNPLLVPTLSCLLTFGLGVPTAARAQPPTACDHLTLSLPTAVLSMVAVDAAGLPMRMTPQALLSSGAVLSVLAVHEDKDGSSWLLERPEDGARWSVRVSGRLIDGVVLAPSAVVFVTAASAGVLLTSAGHVLAFIPDAASRALFHHERVTG